MLSPNVHALFHRRHGHLNHSGSGDDGGSVRCANDLECTDFRGPSPVSKIFIISPEVDRAMKTRDGSNLGSTAYKTVGSGERFALEMDGEKAC